MKKLLAIILSVLLLVSISSVMLTANALVDEDTYGGIDHGSSGFVISYLDPDHNTCRIDDLSYFHQDVTDLVIPSEIDGSKVISIKRLAFYNFENITSVEFPSTLKTIGDMSFSGTGLINLTIPDTVEQIGNGVFAECPNLKTVTVTSGINEESYNAFCLNPSLEEINIGDGIEIIPENFVRESPKLEEVILPDSVTTVQDKAFYDCPGIKRVDTGDGLTSLNGFDFSDASIKNIDGIGTELESIVIGKSVKKINDYQFANCSNLTEFNIGENVEYIGDYAFYNCPLQEEVIIPDSVTRIYNNAFAGSENIKELTTGKGMKSYDFLSFYNIPNLETVIIADGTIKLGNGVLGNSKSLKEIYIPESVTTVNADSISNFSKLTVYGYSNSEAETYANSDERITFVPLDDIDKSELEATLKKAQDIVENKSNEYTDESIILLEEAITKGTEIYKDKIALQEEIDSINTEINTIINEGKIADRELGDVDNNGKVDLNDVITLQKYLAKYVFLDNDSLLYSDANQDNKVDLSDVIHIQKILAKLV